ncbi:MAG: RHS repeat-associated core domain-containing protein [Candidatus Acidiferrum sp.]
MLTAAKEETFSALSDPCVFFPLAASEGVPKNSHLGFARKNPAPHQGSAWSNSGKALGIEEVVWENCGGSDDSARYYDPNVGRFLNEDPMRFRAGVNFYRYVNNRVTDLTDPYGLTCFAGGFQLHPGSPDPLGCLAALDKCLDNNQKIYDNLRDKQRKEFEACWLDCVTHNPPLTGGLAAKLTKCVWKCNAKFAGQLLGDAIGKEIADAACFAKIAALCEQKSEH